MTAHAPIQRYSEITSQSPSVGAGSMDHEGQLPVVESSGEQPWAEFCTSLKKPAFLLAVTGFGDLDYS